MNFNHKFFNQETEVAIGISIRPFWSWFPATHLFMQSKLVQRCLKSCFEAFTNANEGFPSQIEKTFTLKMHNN